VKLAVNLWEEWLIWRKVYKRIDFRGELELNGLGLWLELGYVQL